MKVFVLAAILTLEVAYCYGCVHRGVECIEYEVIRRHPDWEERQYPITVWISVTGTGDSLSRSQLILYRKLFRYIQGDNFKNQFINSTTPTRTKVVPCRNKTDTSCKPEYTMSMMYPADYLKRGELAMPTDIDLFFQKEPPTRYVVRTFSGRPSESEWVDQAHKLAQSVLREPGIAKDHYFLNWYDPPLRLFNRKNEIWIFKNATESSLDIWDHTKMNEVC